MEFSWLNLASALAIGTIIGSMARVRNVRLKANVYTLPFPLTIALLATHGKIVSGNIVGLMLVCVFIWITKMLHVRLRVNVVLADIVGVLVYIAAGYTLVHTVHVGFGSIVLVYVLAWLLLMAWLHTHPIRTKKEKPSALSPLAKGASTSVVSFIMFTLKGLLDGVVVTFPFSGVFAVFEVQNQLSVFLRIVLRNSLALLTLFVVMYPLQTHVSVPVNLAAGWLGYLVVLWFVQKIRI